MLIDLLHSGPAPLTLKEPLNKYIWKAQSDQEKMYKINHLDFTHLPTLVHLGPRGSFFFCCCCFLFQLCFLYPCFLWNREVLSIVFQMLTNADPVAVPYMFPSPPAPFPWDPCGIINVTVSDRHLLQINFCSCSC